MRLLNQGRGTGGYGIKMVGEGSELTASFPGEGNGCHLHRTCLFIGCNDIGRDSRSADADQHGTRLEATLCFLIVSRVALNRSLEVKRLSKKRKFTFVGVRSHYWIPRHALDDGSQELSVHRDW